MFAKFYFKKNISVLGFTLIEMMVAMSILALLASIGFGAYMVTLKKSRDGRRQSDLEQIRTALEIYRSDSLTSQYPNTNGEISTALASLVSGGYIKQLPTDPKSSDFQYYYDADATNNYRSYTLCAHLERGSASDDYCGSAVNCGSGTNGNCNLQVTNP